MVREPTIHEKMLHADWSNSFSIQGEHRPIITSNASLESLTRLNNTKSNMTSSLLGGITKDKEQDTRNTQMFQREKDTALSSENGTVANPTRTNSKLSTNKTSTDVPGLKSSETNSSKFTMEKDECSSGSETLDSGNKTNSAVFYRVPGQYLYDDVLLGSGVPPSRMGEIQHMDIRPDDVIIASYPKTGTTLLQEMVWLISNNGDVDRANQLYNYERILFIEFTPQSLLDEKSEVRYFKTHLPYRFLPNRVLNHKQSKIVYIMRNPKDVVVSYYHFYRMCIPLGNYKGTWDEFFQMFVNNDGKLYYGNVFDHMLAYWNRRDTDPNLKIVFYEDILRKPEEKVREIAAFLNKNMTDNDVNRIVHATSFSTMKDNPKTNWSTLTNEVDLSISPFMRRGIVGDWKTHFTAKQNAIFDRMMNEKLSGSGLTFTYE